MDIQNFIQRTSIRNYTNQKMTKKELDMLTEAINNSPTSTNSQQFSAIIITDQNTKDFISKCNWGQKHISKAAGVVVFVGDKTRNNYFLNNNIEDSDILIQQHSRMLIDATIASAYTQSALMSMGYGVTFIGGLAGFGNELSKYLNLPDTTFIVLGITFGKAASTNDFKPKMNKVFLEKYNEEEAIATAKEYNKKIKEYYKQRNLNKDFAMQIIDECSIDSQMGQGLALCGRYHKEVINKFYKK